MPKGIRGSAPSCSMSSCAGKHKGHGLCERHLRRSKSGAPMDVSRTDPLDVRFWRFVVMGANGCWAWAGFCHRGYGRISDGTKSLAAHRVRWEINRGEIPANLQIDHLCRNPRCVNPDHLEPVTARVNTQRARAAVTHCPQGHEYTPGNTQIKVLPGGSHARACRACHRQREALRRQRRAESSV